MIIIRVIFRYAIKIIANFIKLLSYVFHYILPDKRFSIPKHAEPIISKNNFHIIPNVVWQTNFTNKVTLPVYINYIFNRIMSPTYFFRFCTDEDMIKYIEQNYNDEILRNYLSLTIGASQADYWRILVLYKCGGVYMDIDANLMWPLEFIIKPYDSEIFLQLKDKSITNFFMASKKSNNNYKKIIDTINNNIKNRSSNSVYSLTGPNAVSKALDIEKINTAQRKYICNQGNFTNKYFQYVDKKDGYWVEKQKIVPIIKC